jgi:hypothetical protein
MKIAYCLLRHHFYRGSASIDAMRIDNEMHGRG